MARNRRPQNGSDSRYGEYRRSQDREGGRRGQDNREWRPALGEPQGRYDNRDREQRQFQSRGMRENGGQNYGRAREPRRAVWEESGFERAESGGRYIPESEQRPINRRYDWAERPFDPMDEQREARYREEDRNANLERRRFNGSEPDSGSGYFDNGGTRQMNYGGYEGYGREVHGWSPSQGRDWNQGQEPERYRQSPIRARQTGRPMTQDNLQGSGQFGRGDFGFGDTYSSSERYGRGNLYGDGETDSGWAGDEQVWTGSNSPQFGESWRGQPNHAGKGPRGYQRSDDRIKEEVSEALKDDHAIDASNIDVDVQNGLVTLTGTVDDRYSKRLAEQCIEYVSGVKDVQNQIRVVDQEFRPQTSSSQFGQTSSSPTTSSRSVKESGKEMSKDRLGVTTS